jgi:integrase
VSLDDARKAARVAAGKAALGIDMNEERQQSRAAEAAARVRAEREQGQVTVAGLIGAYVEARKRMLSSVTAREYERTLRVDIAPSALGKLKAPDVTRADIRAYHERLAKAGGPHQSDRALALLKAAYRWGAGEESSPGVSLTGDRDPSRGLLPLVRGSAKIHAVTLLDPKAKTEAERWAGLRVFWKGTEDLPPVARCFVRLLLLLGLRRGEAAAGRWEHVDFELGTWMLPASVRKGSWLRRRAPRTHRASGHSPAPDHWRASRAHGRAGAALSGAPRRGRGRPREVRDRTQTPAAS